MCCYDTGANQRAPLIRQTLDSLLRTVDFSKHRIIIVVNASTEESAAHIADFLKQVGKNGDAIWLPENVGTARGINKAWLTRQEDENAIKMDDDVVIHQAGWVDEMEEAIQYDPEIGIIGLKRKDCWEKPWHPDEFYRSELKMFDLPAGHPWIIVEKVHHVMGTCQMYNSALLDKIGYLYQPGLYGWDDVLAASRSEAAGFYNCFLPHFRIDHIDHGTTPYQEWKGKSAWADRPDLDKLREDYRTGRVPIWYGPNGEQETAPAGPAEAAPIGWRTPNLTTR